MPSGKTAEGAPPDVEDSGSLPTLRSTMRIVGRRAWLVVLCAIVVPVAALSFAEYRDHQYRAVAAADVRPNVSLFLTGVRDPTLYQPGAEVANVNAGLAPSEAVARLALEEAELRGRSASDLLEAVEVTRTGERLHFRVLDDERGVAVALANAYARAFVKHRSRLHRRAVVRTRTELRRTLAAFRRQGKSNSEAAVDVRYRLSVLPADSDVRVVIAPAVRAEQVVSRPLQIGVSGALAGLSLGLALALVPAALVRERAHPTRRQVPT